MISVIVLKKDFVTLHEPSSELDTRTKVELPDVVNRPVIEDL